MRSFVSLSSLVAVVALGAACKTNSGSAVKDDGLQPSADYVSTDQDPFSDPVLQMAPDAVAVAMVEPSDAGNAYALADGYRSGPFSFRSGPANTTATKPNGAPWRPSDFDYLCETDRVWIFVGPTEGQPMVRYIVKAGGREKRFANPVIDRPSMDAIRVMAETETSKFWLNYRINDPIGERAQNVRHGAAGINVRTARGAWVPEGIGGLTCRAFLR